MIKGIGLSSVTSKDDFRTRRLLSRKWLVGTGTATAMLLCGVLNVNLDAAQCAAVVVPAVAYILGESWVDGRRPRSFELAHLNRGQSGDISSPQSGENS